MGNEASAIKRIILLGGVAGVAAIVIGLISAAFHHSSEPFWTKAAPFNGSRQSHAQGGHVRVVVDTPPEIGDTGAGGATLRSLVLPHLFDAEPNGTWSPSLVQPGSDGAARDGRTAWFKLRKQTWSDGSPITVNDLRRTMDTRFVSSVDNPDVDGRITVHLKSRLPGWRMLWSGNEGIAAPKPNVYAGPFTVSSVISGDETVVSRNTNWFEAPFLDSVQLDYVPDSTTARQLFAAGDVDVVAPVADTQRTNLYEALPNATVSSSSEGGRWTALKFNSTSPNPTYAEVLGAFPRSAFVNSLAPGEANVVTGFADPDATWVNYGSAPGHNLADANITISVPIEDPLSSLVGATLQRSVTAGGGKVQVRASDSATVNGYVAAKTYDVAMLSFQSQPQFCWTCVFADVDSALASKADAGDNSAALKLEQMARDGGMFMPLWRDKTLVVYNKQIVDGVTANGYSASVAWNADAWWKP